MQHQSAADGFYGIATQEKHQLLRKPVFRKLRVFAVDPGLTARFEMAIMNEMTLHLPWEELEPGPVGEYVAVVDEDEHGNRLYDPIDLDRTDLLAQDGLSPSDGDPHFHQQMAYAVAMRTIRTFERAMGRLTHWPQTERPQKDKVKYNRRLRLYPHCFQERNAFYDIGHGAFRFGYFVSEPNSQSPQTHVFTCLSQDIIAHELTHGILLGMGFDIQEDKANPDNYGFHEAFADLVALFLHFERSPVLRAQITAIRGRLGEQSPLGAVALQFGQAIGRADGLRNALGYTDESGNWQARVPDPELYQTATQPRARGDILVGAVFDAIRNIYDSRTADLRRLASRGTGELPSGSLHPDLVNRLADEAARSAELLLNMCIRALDFMPPIGATFSDFLRALITANYDADPSDPLHYRVAIAEAFRAYGLCRDIGTVSIDTLLWPGPATTEESQILCAFIRKLNKTHTYWQLPRDREELWRLLESKKVELSDELTSTGRAGRLGAIDLTRPFTVQSMQPRGQVGENGHLTSQWVVKLVQVTTRREPPTAKRKRRKKRRERSGTTCVIDADSGLIRYLINKQPPPPATEAGASPSMQLPPKRTVRLPDERRLRVFAFDPTMGIALETAGINEVTLHVPWERDLAGNDVLGPGPVGEYLEVVDRDPASQAYYAPVNLNHPAVLAQNGLTPSESNPQFHQQMVYAVAMRTIRTFERALGRAALWSPRPPEFDTGGRLVREAEYIQRLRIYPHALREANAYYSPEKKALLFGYFPAAGLETVTEAAPLTVFTCLSHDIIAHETTHALLDGMHRRFNEPSNPDVLAFHEAFADIVALFLHFSLPEVLHHQIAATRGDLDSQNQLGELAQQFGRATSNRGALRSALGVTDPKTGRWTRATPDPDAYRKKKEPHSRGAILVAAVFDAFLSIYKAAIADLLRIVSDGTGVLPKGHLHPDLINRLAAEAARSAEYVLNMCIRALDYCPPVDITFGDYLRAVLTADHEFNPVDEGHRRVAFVEAFRKHGIIPENVQTLSVDGLLWHPSESAPDEDAEVILSQVRRWAPDIASWNLTRDRFDLYRLMRKRRAALHSYLKARMKREDSVTSGLDPARKFEVHSVRPSFRTDWEGRPRFQWIIELTQRIPEFNPEFPREDGQPDCYFRGGTTLVVDAETGMVRYSIKKPLSDRRRNRHMHHYHRQGLGDCFLLSFPGDRGEAHVLIDCGVLKGTEGGTDRIRRIADSVFETTQGRLDALVVTHQHWDHVSGFLQAQSVFNRLQVQQVWLAWTEDPADTLARELSLRKSKAISAVRQAAMRLGAASDHHANQAAGQLINLLGFDGEPGIGGRQTTAKAMEWVKSRTGARVRYFAPGSTPIESLAFENVRIYVLGPPRDPKMLRKSDPSTRAGEVYELSGINGADLGFLAAAGATNEDSPDRIQLDGQPFDEWFRMSDMEVWDDPFFDEYYGGGVQDEDDQSWRRIESDWLGAARRLALQLDSHTNNTSLALAFELLPSGRVLLFPGDAQVGNWLSWGRDWQPEDATTPSGITISDLLARTVLYKVGHHGGRNATLRELGLELMSSGELTAMLPVDRKTARKMGWQMPSPKLYRRLLEKTNGRILDSEFGVSNVSPARANEQEWRDFLSRTEVRPDWLDYRVRT